MQMVDSNLGITGPGISIAIIIVNLLSASSPNYSRTLVDDHFLRFPSIFSSPFFPRRRRREEGKVRWTMTRMTNEFAKNSAPRATIGSNWKIFLDDPFQASTNNRCRFKRPITWRSTGASSTRRRTTRYKIFIENFWLNDRFTTLARSTFASLNIFIRYMFDSKIHIYLYLRIGEDKKYTCFNEDRSKPNSFSFFLWSCFSTLSILFFRYKFTWKWRFVGRR